MHSRQILCAGLVGVGGFLGLGVEPVRAVVINESSDIDLGFGFVNFDGGESNVWSSQETPNVNDPDTPTNVKGVPFIVGNVQFTITLGGTSFSSQGPQFAESGGARILIDNDSSGGGGDDLTAQSINSTVTITASLVDPTLPGDAIAGTDAFSLAIDQISVYALKHTGVPTTSNDFFITEVLPGDDATSPTFTLNSSGAPGDASEYGPTRAWDPPSDPVISGGTTVTRSFHFNTGNNFLLDGIEIIASGVRTYESTIPEPSAATLVGLAATGLIVRRRRSSRRPD